MIKRFELECRYRFELESWHDPDTFCNNTLNLAHSDMLVRAFQTLAIVNTCRKFFGGYGRVQAEFVIGQIFDFTFFAHARAHAYEPWAWVQVWNCQFDGAGREQ